jgi:hypothetical protein
MRAPKPIDWAAIAAAQPIEPYDWTPPDKSSKRHGGDQRGSATDRRRRKLWLLATFGNGERCPCTHCGVELIAATLTADRIVPGRQGGRYVRGNIRPSCAPCAHRQGADMTNGKVLDAPPDHA